MGGCFRSLRSFNSAYDKTYENVNYRRDPYRGLHDIHNVSSYQGYYCDNKIGDHHGDHCGGGGSFVDSGVGGGGGGGFGDCGGGEGFGDSGGGGGGGFGDCGGGGSNW